jgi:predicted nucleic acid-binding protein
MPPNFSVNSSEAAGSRPIADTSCLIALTKTGNLGILRQVCQTVLITPEIAGEYGEALPPWITVVPVRDHEKTRLIQKTLDPGESSAIALALETRDPLLILDDAQARTFALDLGLAITGTLGILIAACRQGIIADLNPVIAALKAADFRLPRDLPEILSTL